MSDYTHENVLLRQNASQNTMLKAKQTELNAANARIADLERIIADAQAAPDAVGAASRAFMKDAGGNHMAAALLAANLHKSKPD